jgi:hypothetical protein
MTRLHINFGPSPWRRDRSLEGQPPSDEELAILREMNDGAIIVYPSEALFYEQAFDGSTRSKPFLARRDMELGRYTDRTDIEWDVFGSMVSKGLIAESKSRHEDEWDTTLRGFNFAFEDEKGEQ